MPLDSTAMTAAHDAIRRDLIRFVRVLGGTDPVPPGRAVALRRHWEFVASALGHYTGTQDAYLWPPARTHVPAPEQAPLAFAVDKHPLVGDYLAVAGAAFAGGGAGSAGPERQILAENVQRLAMLADKRFAYEETVVLPLLVEHLPQESWDAYNAELTSFGPLELSLPWLLDSAPADRISRVLGLLSPDDYDRYTSDWKPAYREQVSLLW